MSERMTVEDAWAVYDANHAIGRHMSGRFHDADRALVAAAILEEHQEKVEALVKAAHGLAEWLQMDRGEERFWCDEEFATSDRDDSGRQVYAECSPVRQCGDCARLTALQDALQPFLPVSIEGGARG